MNLVERTLRAGVEWVQKAAAPRRDESRGTMSAWMRGMPPMQGQPPLTTRESGILPDRMREIVLKTPTAAGALNAILDYACGVDVNPRNVDPSQVVPARAGKFLAELLANPNPMDTERRFRRKLLRDLATLGYAAVEIERGESGGLANLNVLDAARIYMDFDEHGRVLGYNMRDALGRWIVGPDGKHTWAAADVIWYSLDPITSSQFPTSRIEQLFALAVLESLMLTFIGGRFTDSNVPFGVMDLGDVSETELQDAIDLWNEQIAERDHPEHRIIFSGSRGGAKWLPFGYKLNELEASNLLALVRQNILSILGVTVNEMGEADTVNKANGYNLSFTFKKRAIEPMLDEYTQTTTRRLVWEELGFSQAELYYEDIDSRDELLQSQIDDIRLKTGLVSINHVRNRMGLSDTAGGEEPAINLGGSIVPVSKIQDFAQAQLEALQAVNMQARVTIMQALQAMSQPTVNPDGSTSPPPPMQPLGTLPLIRGMQPPEKYTTIDGSGSTTPKFHTEKPNMQTAAAPKAGTPQKPRGPVQAARNQGMRKEDTTHG